MAIKQPSQNSSSSGKTILALILLVIAVAGLFLFVFPKKESFDGAVDTIAEKEMELSRAKNALSKLQSVEDSFEGSEVTQKDVLISIPDSLQQEKIIKTLAKHSEENETTINSLSFGLINNRDGDFSILSITTNISGTHRNIIKFLEALESDSRKFSVNTMSVQVLENGLENMSLTIEAYYL